MALRVGAVLNGPVHLEPIVVLCTEVLYIPQHDALTVSTRLALQLHRRQLAVPQLGLNDVAASRDLERSFLDFRASLLFSNISMSLMN